MQAQENQQEPQLSTEAPSPVQEHDAANTSESATSAADSAPSLEERLLLAEQKAAEHHEAWLRAKAETENTRRRAQEDITKAHKFAVEKFASDLLAVKDTLEMAIADQNPDSLRAGLEMTLKNLSSAFEKAAITELNPVGEKFDPHRHEAMAMVESGQAANTVVQVFQKGYLIADRTLRPAMVTVAKNKDA